MAVIEAQSVSKQFLLRHNSSAELKVRFLGLLHRDKRESVEEFWALRNISLSINPGEAVGLVGRNGSGKSTFLKVVAAIHRPTSGRMLVARGTRISSMIELGVGFHPELTGRENVVLNASIHGLSKAEIDGIYDAVVDYSGLEHFIDVPIKNYSSGMYMRLGFAISANLNPDILLLDEIFAVGDADFQERCIATVRRFMDEGKTIIFVSHSPGSVRTICRRVCVLEHGELRFNGEVDEGLAFYEGLLAHRAGHASGPALAPGSTAAAEGEADSEMAVWPFEFLRREGLEPRHRLLDLGFGTPPSAGRFRHFLAEGRYWGMDWSRVSAVPDGLDFAIANAVFPSLNFNDIAVCIASVVRRLRPSGRFYVTWFDNPDPANFEPIVHPNGITTSYPDREPYHYPLGLLANVCDAVGATVERVADSTQPRGESVLVITRRH